jgi:hypothetical protein
MVHNNNASKLQISSIRLGGGSSSVFSLNIDGTPASSVSDVEIEGHDSIFIFVKVTLNPNNQNNPLVITDSILFNTNGNLQQVALIAWGQDAYFYKNKKLTGDVTWDSIKPRVIYGYLRIDTGASLTINAGTKLYFHKSAYLAVSHLSRIDIEGNLDHPVRLQGDRLDPFYRDLPGQWNGIYLEKGSHDNVVKYAVIRNGNTGIAVDSAVNINGTPMLTIEETIIQNMAGSDIYAYATNILSTNCVLGNCGSAALALDFGGSYKFIQMTIGNFWTSSVRTQSALYLNNYITDTLGRQTSNALINADFGNSIIYGDQEDELTFDKNATAPFNFTFNYCLLKTLKSTSDPLHYNTCIVNKDPGFVDVQKFDFEIDSISAAIGQGNSFFGFPTDIKGNPRNPNYDQGAYQYIPK